MLVSIIFNERLQLMLVSIRFNERLQLMLVSIRFNERLQLMFIKVEHIFKSVSNSKQDTTLKVSF